ncbi:MAG: hypothetical protein ACYC5O_12090 [Anaerolineae bacterium]
MDALREQIGQTAIALVAKSMSLPLGHPAQAALREAAAALDTLLDVLQVCAAAEAATEQLLEVQS